MQHFIVRAAALASGLLLVGAAWAEGRAAGGWQKISNPAPVFSGLDGKPHTAACSGFPGTDPGYSFWAKRGRSKNLVVYFEGGGACWNDQTCSFPFDPAANPALPQVYAAQIPPGSPADYDGIFNAANKANPVKDWSFVYIPYCSGDVHTGTRTRNYSYVFTGATLPIHHGGYDNFMVVMDWVRKNVATPDQLLVAGSSAGGYGASANFPWVQKVFPKARLAVLADASQGVLSAGFDAAEPGRNSWNPQLMPQVFGTDVNAVATPKVLAQAAAAFPKARVAQFTTNFDEVQASFHALAASYNPPGFVCNDPASSWNVQMLQTLKNNVASARNYRHYLAAGSYHTILRSPQFYTEASTGRPFSAWMAAMLDSEDSGDHRKRWDNQACPGCLVSACPP